MRLSRREFMLSTGGAGLGLLVGCGRLPWQGPAPGRVYRLGYLGPGLIAPFRESLRDLGYLEGQNLVVERRDEGGRTDRLADLAAELVALQPEVIVTPSSLQVGAAKAATSTIPIVNLGGGLDLVDLRLVDSLARPGANVTGLTSANNGLHGKRLQLLTEAAAPVRRVAVLYDASMPAGFIHVLEPPARHLGIELLSLEPYGPDELYGAFESAVRWRADAAVVASTPLSVAHRDQVVALAAQHRLPAIYESTPFMSAGGLMAYLGSPTEMQRRAAYYVDRILKGAKPADLPIEQPMTFDFVVNLKTAQALGITFPNEIMLQVTEVIDQ